MPRFYCMIALVLGLAACSGMPDQDPVPEEPSGTCGADRFQSLVGLSHDDLLRIEILGPVRVIRLGDAVTMDFLPSRLNIALDAGDRVSRVFCG
ncbi:MAG: I78 family peptidase inhibitor [Pseudomonadota bacterium]